MDLQLVLRVLWRFKLIVAAGLILAITLAVMSYAKVSFEGGKPTFAPRETEQWESLSTLFVTSHGFPWGAIGTPPTQDQIAAGIQKEQGKNPAGLDPVHLISLAALYVRLATSDSVLKMVERSSSTGKLDGKLQAFPVSSDDTGDGSALPMVTFSAIATSAERAKDLSKRHSEAFVRYIEREQSKAEIPRDERVVVEIARAPQPATLLEARKKTRPMVVFVAVMLAVIGLCFALENLRPRVRVLSAEQKPVRPVEAEVGRGTQPRRTAPASAATARRKSRNTA